MFVKLCFGNAMLWEHALQPKYAPQGDFAVVAQSVEHLHGKEKVCGSIPHNGSTKHPQGCFFDIKRKTSEVKFTGVLS